MLHSNVARKDLNGEMTVVRNELERNENNPGGILEQSVQVADVFLDGGEVVTQRGRNPSDIERFNARPGDARSSWPADASRAWRMA